MKFYFTSLTINTRFRKTPNIPKNRKLARNVKISYHDNRKTKRVSTYQSVWDLQTNNVLKNFLWTILLSKEWWKLNIFDIFSKKKPSQLETSAASASVDEAFLSSACYIQYVEQIFEGIWKNVWQFNFIRHTETRIIRLTGFRGVHAASRDLFAKCLPWGKTRDFSWSLRLIIFTAFRVPQLPSLNLKKKIN